MYFQTSVEIMIVSKDCSNLSIYNDDVIDALWDVGVGDRIVIVRSSSISPVCWSRDFGKKDPNSTSRGPPRRARTWRLGARSMTALRREPCLH